MSSKENFTMSNFSLNSNEDWDRSESDIIVHQTPQAPRNSVPFPGESAQDCYSTPGANGNEKGRSLSELMRLHAEKGTDVTFNLEEATRVADVLKQWINSGTSPYEGEDDFFSRANDDSSLGMKRSSQSGDLSGRSRGQSESIISLINKQSVTCDEIHEELQTERGYTTTNVRRMLKSPRKKSATPSRPARRNGARQSSVKREPPEIDLSAIRPPSPTEDPLLLSARRTGQTIWSRVTPVFSSSPPVSTIKHADAQDTQWDAWTDSDSEGEGEYTGRFKMFHVPTKADPPTSGTKARMEEWGRPVSPFPYEARLDRSLPDPQAMDIADSEDEGMEANILDALDVESSFEDIVEVPPASDDLSSDPATSDFHVGAEQIQDSDVEVESDVIRITGSDPKAAARAAAILRLHDYDCVLASSKQNTRKPRISFVGAETGKHRSPMQGQHTIHNLEHTTPWCDIEDIMQDKTFIEQHTPVKSPSHVSLERASHPSSSTTCSKPGYKPKAGEWRREDWKLLDRCFFEESHVSGVTVAPDEVNKEAVVMRFKRLVGGHDVVMELGSPWSWENLLARVDVLVKKRAARTDVSTLSFASFMSHDISTFANVTPAPLSRIPRYRDLLNEATSIDTSIPMHTSSYAARSQPTIPPINRLAEKTGFFFKLPTWTSFLPRRVDIKPDDHPIQDCPSLPPPPTDIMDHRKPVKTPSRKPSEQRKPHRDFVNLHHTSPRQKRAQLCRSQPKRLVELRHISPEPFQRVYTNDRRTRRSSGDSVKDLIRSFELTKDPEPVTGGPRHICANTLENRLAWKP